MSSSLENGLVDVLKQIAVDIRDMRKAIRDNSDNVGSGDYTAIKSILNKKGYYCKDTTLQSILECLASNMRGIDVVLTYEKKLDKCVFTSLPYVVFSIDDIKYTIGEDGTYTYSIPKGKRYADVKLYGYIDSVIKEFKAVLSEDLINLDTLIRDGTSINSSNQYTLVQFKTKSTPNTYIITSTAPVNGDSNGYVGGIMWKVGASAADNMNVVLDGSAENYVALNYLRYSFIKYTELTHKVRIFVRHTTQDTSKGNYNSPLSYITTDLNTVNRGLVSVYTEKLTEFIKRNYGISSDVINGLRNIYGSYEGGVLTGVYTLDGSEVLVYYPSKQKFEYVSIV